MSKKNGVGPKATAALDATGLDWWVEGGKKHRKVFLSGRLAAVLAHGSNSRGRSEHLDENNAKSIRRLAEAIKRGDA